MKGSYPLGTTYRLIGRVLGKVYLDSLAQFSLFWDHREMMMDKIPKYIILLRVLPNIMKEIAGLENVERRSWQIED